MSILRFLLSSNMAGNDDYQSDRTVFRPLYEKERSQSGGVRRQAFDIVDQDVTDRVTRGGEFDWRFNKYSTHREYINGDLWRYRNREYWYENLLKRVDEVEKNLKSSQSLTGYAEKRGRIKGISSLFSGLGEHATRSPRNNPGNNELGIMGGIGL